MAEHPGLQDQIFIWLWCPRALMQFSAALVTGVDTRPAPTGVAPPRAATPPRSPQVRGSHHGAEDSGPFPGQSGLGPGDSEGHGPFLPGKSGRKTSCNSWAAVPPGASPGHRGFQLHCKAVPLQCNPGVSSANFLLALFVLPTPSLLPQASGNSRETESHRLAGDQHLEGSQSGQMSPVVSPIRARK